MEISLKNSDEISIRIKDRTINVNVAQSQIDAGLDVGVISGAGEFEIGDATIMGIAVESGVMYRLEAEGIAVGVVGAVKVEELDELGPIDVLATSDLAVVKVVEPKILIPIGNMDIVEVKATIKVEKKLKLKNASVLPAMLEVYKLD